MERLQAQIAKDIEGKNFKTIEEINAYIQEKYLNKEVEFDTTNLTPKEKAMDLVYEAMDSDNKKKIITLAEKALKLDEDCADAYNLLARHKAKTSEEILEFYAKGIEAGKRSLGSDFDKMKGKFWGFHETRPFMRAMAGYADILWHLKERSKSVEVMKEMLLSLQIFVFQVRQL